MDPNTLILDQDPGFWPNLYPDLRLCYKLTEKFKLILEINNFFYKSIFCKKKMSPKIFVGQ